VRLNILLLCNVSDVMGSPWWEAGHNVTMVDTQHAPGATLSVMPSGATVTRIGADLRKWRPGFERWDAVFAFPPCTDLAGSGARWWAAKGPGALRSALGFVRRVRRLVYMSGARCWAIENPVGRLATFWRKPDHYFDPCDFGGYVDGADAYTKRTCLWASPGFIMPTPRRVAPTRGSLIHMHTAGVLPTDSPEVAARKRNARNKTPAGLARAVFEANEQHLIHAATREAA
jgi:hypothetical protein